MSGRTRADSTGGSPSSDGTIGAGAQLALQLHSALDAARKSLETSFQAANTEAKNTIDLLKGEELKKAADKDPELKKQLPAIEEKTKTKVDDLKTIVDERRKGLAQLQNDLEELVAQLFQVRQQL